MKSDPTDGAPLEGAPAAIVSTFVVLGIALMIVSIWAIIRLVLHYT